MEFIFNAGESMDVSIMGKPLTVVFDQYPKETLERVWRYGWNQILNDGHALPKGASQDEHYAMAMKRNDKLLKGELAVRTGGRVSDPIEVEAFAMAVNDVKAEWRGKRKLDAKAVEEEAKARVEKYPMYRTLAQENIERRKAMAAAMEDTVDDLVAAA